MKQPRVFPRLFAGLVVSLSLALPAIALETFPDEAKAQQHCPKDVVVWLNLPTMIWHYKGQRWYANTIHGASDRALDRASLLGVVHAPPN
jgi:hypothetical protein